MSEQLDLFSWHQPSAHVFIFPIARNSYRVRLVADNLERKHGQAADVYWRSTVTRIANELRRQGLNEEGISAEISAFFRAVEMELRRRSYRAPGGVA